MFIANIYVDVYRQDSHQVYSEYDVEQEAQTNLVYRKMPMHITAFRPGFSIDSNRDGQWTRLIADHRDNYHLREDDKLLTSDGRRFTVKSIEPTNGAFIGNSNIVELVELDATH